VNNHDPEDFWFSVHALVSTAIAIGAMLWFASSCAPHAHGQDSGVAMVAALVPAATSDSASGSGAPVTLECK
jgi:hypothetical protein